MMMRSMDDLFLHLVKDLYHAEKQLVRALPKMAKATENAELKQAFQQHAKETEGQVERLERVFKMLDKAPRGEKCMAMMGLIEEGEEVIENGEDGSVIDAGLISGAQAVEHYEIARYGTLVAWAKQLGLNDAVPLLEKTLEEEKKTDQLLNQLALKEVNRQAA